jgi:serine/threonine-protein kinase
MQYLRGGSLERRLDDGPLGPDSTRRLLAEIGSALAAAHDRGVVHRDVKPGNVLFDELDNAYLTDFGIAWTVGHDDSSVAALSPGSPHYSAPEQLRREAVGPAADQYSLGLVAWECLAGRSPLFGAVSGP